MGYSLRQNPADYNNYTDGRTSNIDKIIIHHAATTYFDGIGITFANPNRQASAHYGVGNNNNVDQYVDEGNTAWHAGNWQANCSSIGIETVNCTGAPDWLVSESAFITLVELVRDIATRNGLMPLQVGVNLFGHKDFQQTFCPGVLYPRLQELADKVNGGTPSHQPSGPDQVLEVGSRFVFPKTYRVDDLQFINGTWQVRTNELCPQGFTWDDNGIPVEPLNEVAPNTDQVLTVGSEYTIPGEYTVLNLGVGGSMWLAQIDMGGWRLWVDIATVTEI